ncbi:hypothetical protein CR513_14391, partial [Mucuna pruriens]
MSCHRYFGVTTPHRTQLLKGPFCLTFGTHTMIQVEVEELSPRAICTQGEGNEEDLRENLDLLQEEREMAYIYEYAAKGQSFQKAPRPIRGSRSMTTLGIKTRKRQLVDDCPGHQDP